MSYKKLNNMENYKWINGYGEYVIQPRITASTRYTYEGEAFDAIIDNKFN
jgi:hypothetical protein